MTFRDWSLRSLFIGLLMLTVGACGTIGGDGNVPFGSLGQRVAESVIPVSDENRDLRVCWLAAGAVEVITDLARRGGAAEAGRALGHLVMLQGAIGKASLSDSFWIETDTADVSLIFAVVLKDLGKTRLSQILLGGPTISNFLNVAKRTIVLTVKGNAAMRDINRVLQGVEDGIIDKADAFKACEDRTLMNGDVLRALTGGPTLSGVERTVDKSLNLTESWRDEKQMIGDPHTDMRVSGGEHDIQTADWVVIYPEEWVTGGGGTWPFAMGGSDEIILGHDPKDGNVTSDYTEFVEGKPVDGDVNAGGWGLRAELGFIYKGDALVDGVSILAGRPIG